MAAEPVVKRAIAFVDGQNLFFAAKDAFGYTHPNYDFPALASTICASKSWDLTETRFYTANSDWVKIDRATYDKAIDPRDYRRPKPTR